MAWPNASVVSSGLGAYPTVYYDRKALDTLRNHLSLYPVIDSKKMPDMSGVVMQIFNYSAFAANTVAVTEGTPGNGQALSQNTGSITLSQYSDYISFSDKSVLTAISDIVTEGSEELGYRGALSVDTVIREQLDLDANGSAAARIDLNDGTYLTASKIRQAVYSLRSANIKTKADGKFKGVVHSLTAFDLVNDSTAGGFIDLMKYTENNAKRLQEGITGGWEGPNRIGEVGGCELFESNNMKSYATWQSSAHTAYMTIVIGRNAYVQSSLGKTELGEKNFSIKVTKNPPVTAVDPQGLIKAFAAYNFFYGLVKRPDSTPGFRRIRCESSLS
jgi:N4-gp56 family major capsid protein